MQEEQEEMIKTGKTEKRRPSGFKNGVIIGLVLGLLITGIGAGQNELPRSVFDASTSGLLEAVLHFNTQPSTNACLSCIYYEAQDESAHEIHVAEILGVAREDVKSNFITPATSKIIAARHGLESKELEGLAYDSLFKQLCGQGQLKVESQRVLAPFGFVSALAGIMLAIEVARRVANKDAAEPFNYWRISPWHSPVILLRERRTKRTNCEFCDSEEIQAAVRQLWE